MPANPFALQRRNAKILDLLDFGDVADIDPGPGVKGQRLGLTTRPIKPSAFQPTATPVWYKVAFPLSTFPEYLALYGANELGLKATNDPRPEMRGDDFTMQKQVGQARGIGSQKTDLVFERPNKVGVYVNGLHWHPDYGAVFVRQIEQYGVLNRQGYRTIAIDETQLYKDAVYAMREAVFNLRSDTQMKRFGGG